MRENMNNDMRENTSNDMRGDTSNDMRENMSDNGKNTAAEGFCDGCGRRCPLSDPHCPTGMEKAGMEIPEGGFEDRKRGEHKGEGHEHGGRRHEVGERMHRGEGHEGGRHGHRHGERRGEERGHGGCRHEDRDRGHRRPESGKEDRDWFEGASEEDLLLHSFRRCSNHLKHGRENRSSQQQLLAFLSAAGGSAVQSELGGILNVRRASISELLAKMEARGLIERHQDENDRRQLIVSLTQQGAFALSEGADHRKTENSALFSALSDEERHLLQTLLNKLLLSWKE